MNSSALIAVIDDDDPFLDLMQDVLSEEGYRVVVGRVAADGMALILANHPALIIVDIVMAHPDSGFILLNEIRADATLNHVPVMVCSAALNTLISEEARIRALGAVSLGKPFDLDTLLTQVRELLGTAYGKADAAGS